MSLKQPNESADPPDLQQIYGRFSAGGDDTGLNIWSFGDCVSALVICPVHRTLALAPLQNGFGLWLPTVILKFGQTYANASADLFQKAFPNANFKSTPEVIEKTRFQMNNRSVSLTLHAAELLSINQTSTETTSIECACKKGGNLSIRWLPYGEIQIKMTFTKKARKGLEVDEQECLYLAGPEPMFYAQRLLANEQILNSDLSLHELAHKSIVSWITASTDTCEMVRKCAGLEEDGGGQDFIALYDDFVQHCFPSTYMNAASFEDYVQGLQLVPTVTVDHINQIKDQPDLCHLFPAFDVQQRGFIDFFQFITGLAVMDPNKATLNLFSAIRAEYIFRFYNRSGGGGSGEMDFTDFYVIAAQLLIARNPDLKYEDIPAEYPALIDTLCRSVFGPVHAMLRQPISRETFMNAVNGGKIRDLHLLFRSGSRSIQCIMQSLSQSNKKKTQEESSNLNRQPYKLLPDYIKLNSDGQFIESQFIPYAIDGLPKEHVYWEIRRGSSSSSASSSSRSDRQEMTFQPPPVLNAQEEMTKYYEEFFNFIRDVIHAPNLHLEWQTPEWRMTLIDDIVRLCEDVASVFAAQCRILKLDPPCYVFGDIHGSAQDIANYDSIFWCGGSKLLTSNNLMCGDFVDRGAHSIECILYMFCLKVLAPQRFHMIRGNHEERSINARFSFKDECKLKFGPEAGELIWEAVNRAFDCMPPAALIDGQIYCAHGGFPSPVSKLSSIERAIPVCLPDPLNNSWMVTQILYNDPLEDYLGQIKLYGPNSATPGFRTNYNRGNGLCFYEPTTRHFLELNRLSYIIRAHEACPNGFKCDFGGRIITVFSSSNYRELLEAGQQNPSALALVGQDRTIRIICVNYRPLNYANQFRDYRHLDFY